MVSGPSLLHVTPLLPPELPVWSEETSPSFYVAGTLTTSIIALARYIDWHCRDLRDAVIPQGRAT